MQEINVFISGGKIRVAQEVLGMHSGEPVVWNFHNCEAPTVKWAQVEFEDEKASVFKARTRTFSTSRGTDVDGGSGCIVGTAPPLRSKMTDPGVGKAFKYRVRACTGDPTKGGLDAIPPLDPEIIVEDP
jgi:hypothetical protein